MRLFHGAPILVAGVAIQLFSAVLPAAAQSDIPYGFVPLWNGLYFGAHGGGALGSAAVADSYHYNYYYTGPNNGGPASAASNTLSLLGAFGGGQAGYNFQWGHLVLGVEGNAGYFALSSNKSVDLTPSADCLAAHASNKSRCSIAAKYSDSGSAYGDLTGRLGFLAGRALFYGKGGGAVMLNNFQASYTGGTSAGQQSWDFDNNGMLWGWTAGGGVEYKFSPSWSFKAEYQHFDFLSATLDHGGQTAVNWYGSTQTYLLKGNAAISPTIGHGQSWASTSMSTTRRN